MPDASNESWKPARRGVPEPGPVSPLLWRFMVAYFDRFLRRHLNAVRLARWGRPDGAAHPGPIVVYCNHPAWWDAVTLILLGARLFPGRIHHAPFDADALERYAVFRRMGAFGVDLDSRRGAAQFLSASRAILGRPGRMLWITAQGRFADVRARPLGLRPGVARLPEIAPDALVLPLALEYAFWEERGAEAFAAFGTPIPAADLLALPRPARLARLEADLGATLDRLSADVIAREPGRFVGLVSGAKGVGGVYDSWRRLRALMAGRRFDAAHRAAGEAKRP
ncbi:1-acyl-sn-glycerol-3-phosphate acyltransferase [Methylobacterium sp. BE186]|nr:1-acyl-sn-glycerol-3-phosphate acyltransferase [Methylobacterium sp. BE186]